MKWKLILIKWIDSKGGSPEWEYLENIEPLKPMICLSVGFLLDDNEEYKTIAPTIGGGQVLGRITIPTCSILKIEILNK